MPLKTVVKEIPFQPSTLETVDYAMYGWLNEELDLFTTTQDGWEKVPVIWVAAERAFQVKRKKELRDQDGTLVLPLMTIERTSVVKDLTRKGALFGNVPPVDDYKGGSIVIGRKIQQEKTANFANADAFRRVSKIAGTEQRTFPKKNEKIVYQYMSIPIPVYLDITYQVTIKTEYQQQMNELMTPFATKTGGINYFMAFHDGHRFESFIQSDFTQDNNASSMEVEHRKYETKIDIKTLGYVIGEDANEEQPKIVIRENPVEFKFPRERTMTQDEVEHLDKRGFYRET
tara:strand:- start:4355 stop:5215 length:861 start_codon:yes stop_codon:yes gene_type:complete